MRKEKSKVTLHSKAPAGSLISTLDVNTKLAIGKRAKAEAIEFLTLNGIAVDKRCTYAVKKESKEEYWANPNVELLNTDWYIMDYKMSSSNSSSSGTFSSPRHSLGGTRIPTWVFVIAILGIVSGDLPINGFTVLLAIVFAGIVLVRVLNS